MCWRRNQASETPSEPSCITQLVSGKKWDMTPISLPKQPCSFQYATGLCFHEQVWTVWMRISVYFTLVNSELYTRESVSSCPFWDLLFESQAQNFLPSWYLGASATLCRKKSNLDHSGRGVTGREKCLSFPSDDLPALPQFLCAPKSSWKPLNIPLPNLRPHASSRQLQY